MLFNVPPVWDTAMVCIGILLLSPLVRKAHLVLLLFPIFVAIAALYANGTSRGSITAKLCLFAAAILTFGGTSIETEELFFDYPINFTLLLGVVVLALTLCFLKIPPGDQAARSTEP
jgi:hypothetical protein